MFWYPSIFVVLSGWTAGYLYLHDARLEAAMQITSALVFGWLVLPIAWCLPGKNEPVTVLSMATSCVAVLWAPHLALEWYRGQLQLARGIPNLLFALFVIVYYLVYRDRSHEHMLRLVWKVVWWCVWFGLEDSNCCSLSS